MEHVKVLTESAIIVQRVDQLLHEAGITTIVRDHVESARLAGYGTFSNAVELFVPKSQSAEANKIISLFLKELPPEQ